MEEVLTEYRRLQGTLLRGDTQESLLPNLKVVALEQSPLKTFDSIAEMATWLSSALSESAVSGWATLQSETVLIGSTQHIIELLDSSYLINAELASDNRYFQVFYDGGKWCIAEQSVNPSDSGLFMAERRYFAIDSVRFEQAAPGRAEYSVLWRMGNEGPVQIGQHFHGIEKGEAGE